METALYKQELIDTIDGIVRGACKSFIDRDVNCDEICSFPHLYSICLFLVGKFRFVQRD